MKTVIPRLDRPYRHLNANDKESLTGMDNALVALWKTVHDAAY